MNLLQLILAQLTDIEIVVTERKNSREIRIKGVLPHKSRASGDLN